MKPKTLKERLTEVQTIYKQLFDDLGFPMDYDGINEFRQAANEFVKTGEGMSGSIPIPSVKRTLVYTLSNQQHITSFVVLKHMP